MSISPRTLPFAYNRTVEPSARVNTTVKTLQLEDLSYSVRSYQVVRNLGAHFLTIHENTGNVTITE